jgi:hypothetical protein
MSDSDEIYKIPVTLIGETGLAFLLQPDDAELGGPEWLPKSKVNLSPFNIKTKKGTANIPEWLMKKLGWI